MYRVVIMVLGLSSCLWAESDPLALYAAPEESFKVYESLEDALAYPQRVRAIRLHKMHLKQLPEGLKRLTELEYLSVANNEISLNENDAEVLRSLKKLKSLILWKNKISRISPVVVDAMSPVLESLGLESNQIESLPEEFVRLDQLRVLTVSNNPIKSFPEVILKLEGLVILWIMRTEIEYLDHDFRMLSKLEDLFMTSNSLEMVKVKLPKSIVRLILLNNKITSLEGNFEECPNLELVNMLDNPEFMVPEELQWLWDKGILKVGE